MTVSPPTSTVGGASSRQAPLHLLGKACSVRDLELDTDVLTHIDGTHERKAVAAPHLTGPPEILQGGLATGVLLAAARAADRFGAPTTAVQARLHAPTPVGRPITTRVQRAEGAFYEVESVDGDQTLVTGSVELAGNDPVPRVHDLVALADAPLPEPVPTYAAAQCWVCGPDNPHGLHLHPAWLPTGEILQGWAPSEDLADADGHLDEVAICAVLDCPTVWAAKQVMDAEGFGAALLAGMHVRFFRPAPVMEPLRIVARLDDVDGRKLSSRAALLDEDGAVYAVASALQIGVTEFPSGMP